MLTIFDNMSIILIVFWQTDRCELQNTLFLWRTGNVGPWNPGPSHWSQGSSYGSLGPNFRKGILFFCYFLPNFYILRTMLRMCLTWKSYQNHNFVTVSWCRDIDRFYVVIGIFVIYVCFVQILFC